MSLLLLFQSSEGGGEETTTVPSIIGLTQAAAETAITDADCDVGDVTTAYHASVGIGLVISQDPGSGGTVVIGTDVDFVVSLGPSSLVPDVVGLSQASAEAAIVAENLDPVVTTAYDGVVAIGLVISQDPAASTEVPEGDDVDIVVSLGPAPVLTLTPATLPAGYVGVAYSQTVVGTNGAAPYSYAVTAGTLPTGLSLNAGTGAITGTPTTVQSASFTITVTDNVAATDPQAYSVGIFDLGSSAGRKGTRGRGRLRGGR